MNTNKKVDARIAAALAERHLLERCRHEITNLMDKLGRKEPAGWEGVQRRILLMSDLNKALGS